MLDCARVFPPEAPSKVLTIVKIPCSSDKTKGLAFSEIEVTHAAWEKEISFILDVPYEEVVSTEAIGGIILSTSNGIPNSSASTLANTTIYGDALLMPAGLV